MILDQSGIFTQSIQSNNTAIIPVVVFSKNNIDYYISTNAVTMDGNYYEPLLLNIPSIRESVDFEKRNFKIGNISLSISNSAYGGDKRFSDNLPDIMNAECFIYYKTTVTQNLNDCLKVYQGKVKRMSHNDTTISLQVEDLSQENLHKELPTQRVETDFEILDRYKNKPFPFVYGLARHLGVIVPQGNDTDDWDFVYDDSNMELQGFVDKYPLKVLTDDREFSVQNTMQYFTTSEDQQLEYNNLNNKITLKRVLLTDDYSPDSQPLSPFASGNIEATYTDSPRITLNVEDTVIEIPYVVVNNNYYNPVNNQKGRIEAFNSEYEFINKDLLSDKNYSNFANVHNIPLEDIELCNVSLQGNGIYYGEGISNAQQSFTGKFIKISAVYNPLNDSENIIHKPNSSLFRLNFKLILKDFEFNGQFTNEINANMRIENYLYAYLTTQNSLAWTGFNELFIDNLNNYIIGLLWNYPRESELNYYAPTDADLNTVADYRSKAINLNFIPQDITGDNTEDFASINFTTKLYSFDALHYVEIQDVYNKDIYVNIAGRKGIKNTDYNENYVNKVDVSASLTFDEVFRIIKAVKTENRLIDEYLVKNTNIEIFDEDNNFLTDAIINEVTDTDTHYHFNLDTDYLPEVAIQDKVVNIKIVNNFIELPCDIMRHILINEVGFDGEINDDELQIARDESDGYYFSLSQSEFINSKKLIENIAKQSKFFPKFRNDGSFGFNTIKDEYSDEDAKTIEIRDIINYKFDRTKIDDIKTKIKIIYGKNIAGDFLKATDYMTASQYFSGYNNSYIGLEEDHRTSTLDFEAEYIQHDETANLLRNFLLSWYANQHNIITVDLPLRYLKFEVGDVVKFDGLINNLKLYGEDYTIINNRNGQDIYPYFMIMETVKNINKITFKLLQLHKNLPVEQQDDIQTELNRSGMKIPLEQEIDKVLKPTNIMPTDDVIPRTESQDDDGQDVGSGGRGGGGY
tara:strand:+ start:6269 stop:9181 length:2913 start_codon:yes stop_codon:yes gene_type:complete